MTKDKDAMEKAAAMYVSGPDCEISDTFSSHCDTFEAGWMSAHSGPKVLALVEAARKYLNTAPVDGWHFEDCTMNEDEEIGCSCGTGPAEIGLHEALAEFEGEK